MEKFSHRHCGGIVTLFSMGLDTLSAFFLRRASKYSLKSEKLQPLSFFS